jgi:anaphase-promoting complex subunit 2
MFETRIKQPQFIAAVKLVANKRDDLFFAKRTRLPADAKKTPLDGLKKSSLTNFKAQVLSSFFWPQLRSNDYKMPESINWLTGSFMNSFELQGTQQKLRFQPALSKVSVRLKLEDRLVEESDLPGWRASVIDMFASQRIPNNSFSSSTYNDAIGLTPEQLMEALNMEEELVQDALTFWTSKSVLYRRSTGAYSVLERLNIPIESAQQPDVESDDQGCLVSAVKSQDAMLRESAPMFSTFIANMLRNQGPKEVGGMMGITSLLKMVLPSFTYGEEEVRWLLGEMLARGEVVREGEVWKVVA